MSVAGSIGSPTLSALNPATNCRSNSSAIDSATMKRLAAMQDWPLLIVRALTAVRTAASRSALGITTNGSLPPSSSTLFLMSLPAALATWLPASSLPVSVTAATRGSSMTRSTWSVPISSVWKHALGEPGAAEDVLDRERALRARWRRA